MNRRSASFDHVEGKLVSWVIIALQLAVIDAEAVFPEMKNELLGLFLALSGRRRRTTGIRDGTTLNTITTQSHPCTTEGSTRARWCGGAGLGLWAGHVRFGLREKILGNFLARMGLVFGVLNSETAFLTASEERSAVVFVALHIFVAVAVIMSSART